MHFRTPHGPAVLVFVGALNVGSISTPWSGEIRPRKTGTVDAIDLSTHETRRPQGRPAGLVQHGIDRHPPVAAGKSLNGLIICAPARRFNGRGHRDLHGRANVTRRARAGGGVQAARSRAKLLRRIRRLVRGGQGAGSRHPGIKSFCGQRHADREPRDLATAP